MCVEVADEIDVTVEDHGSVMIFQPRNNEAREWFLENVQGDATWFGGGLVVEPRYADNLADGLRAGGFEVDFWC